MIHRRNRKEKSKFQQRLDEVAKEHREMTEDPGPSEVNLHNENPGDPGDGETQSAQRDLDRGWFCTRLHPPPYYAPVDLWVGEDIMEGWHRVSDGDNDYYCNSKDNSIITEPSHWRKRLDVDYPYYEPMTEDDILILTTNDIKEIVKGLDKIIKRRIGGNLPHTEYVAGVDDAIVIVEACLKQKTQRNTQ